MKFSTHHFAPLSLLLPALALIATGAGAQPAASSDAVHIIPFSHEDVGYANNPYVLRTENRLENMFRALRFCDETAGFPDAAKFRYQQEVAEPLPFFLSACTPQERARFAGYLRDGRIAVAATHTTVLADRLTPEAAARLFYLSGRHMPDMLDVPAPKVAMINDVTGMPWSLPIYCEAAQVPYLFHGHNSCGRCDELAAAPLVRWRGAGGTGSVLVHAQQYNPYHNPNISKLIPGYTAKKTPSYLPIFLDGWDFAVADRQASDAAKAWNAAHPDKIARVATFMDWFPAQEKRAKPAEAPIKTGPCQWMDQPITDAWLFGRARQAAERLPTAEKWNAIALATAPETGVGQAYPWFDLTSGWHALLSGFEHTVGAACWRCKNAEGFTHYEVEQLEHREEGLTAEAVSKRTLDAALAALTSRISTQHSDGIAVFNAMASVRSGPVMLDMPPVAGKKQPHFSAVDDVTGAQEPCQWLNATTLAFVAKEVPALGYRTFHLVVAPAVEPRATGESAAESPFYRIALDSQTGCLTSLCDKELNRELVRKDAPQAFNQYLRLHIKESKKRNFLTDARQSDAHISIEHGPVADIVHVQAKTPNAKDFKQTITLWHGVKRVDFALELVKLPSGRSLVDYFANNLVGKEAAFISLPFDIKGAQGVFQTGGGGVARPVRDQFSGTGTAFYAVQHFADLSDGQFGVTVSPIDSSLVEFGSPRADAVSRVLPGSESRYEKSTQEPKDGTLQLFLMNNMFSTNIRVDQPGPQAFHFALRSHAGDWLKGKAAQFGEEVNQPMVARKIPAGGQGLAAGSVSFAHADAPNVSLSTLKPAEWNADGFIVRLVETEGRATRTLLQVPGLGALASAEEVSLTENTLGKPLAITQGAIAVDLPAFGVKTLRLLPAGAKPAAVEGVTAKPLSDLEVSLAWKPTAGAAFYRVYRGETADFTPTPINLVALCAGSEMVDRAKNHGAGWLANRLRRGATFFYRVEAVSRGNQRGPMTGAVAATTSNEATCAPAPVEGLQAVAVSPLAPINQIALIWRSNVEAEVAAYEIHRSRDADFVPSEKTLLKKEPVVLAQKASRFRGLDHQAFVDQTAAPATSWHYKVRAVFSNGLVGPFSQEASAATRKASEVGPGGVIHGKVEMGNDAAQ